MNNEIIVLSSQTHRTHGYARYSDYLFSKAYPVVDVVMAELSELLPRYALAFIKNGNGGFSLVAVLSVYAQDNLYIDAQGRWMTGYVPRTYRTYPLLLREVSLEEKTQRFLCFNQGSGLYRETPDTQAGEGRFFDDEGKVEPFIEELLGFLTVTENSKIVTNAAVAALANANLLEPWVLDVKSEEVTKQVVKGLYRVNEKALGALDAEQLKVLQDVHALVVAYAQLLSIPRLGVLKELDTRRRAAQEQQRTKELDLDAFFAEGSESVKFNF